MSNKPIALWTRKECEEYLEQYPQSLNSNIVRKRYASFKDELDKEADADNQFWEKNKNTTLGISEYMLNFKKGLHISECDDAYWKLAQNDLQELKKYQKLFPQGKHLAKNNSKLSDYETRRIALKSNKKVRTFSAIDNFICFVGDTFEKICIFILVLCLIIYVVVIIFN